MTKPLIPANFLTSVTNAKPVEHGEGGNHATKSVSKAPMPKVKASTKPAKNTVSHTRSSNRGK